MSNPGEAGGHAGRRGGGQGWAILPLLLAVLALLDLRDELLLLLDRPTITASLYLLRSHPLAVLVLLMMPSLWKRYRRW
jgi:hypothetical protein